MKVKEQKKSSYLCFIKVATGFSFFGCQTEEFFQAEEIGLIHLTTEKKNSSDVEFKWIKA